MSYEKFKAELDLFTRDAEAFKEYHEKKIADGLDQLEKWEPRWKSSDVMKKDMAQVIEWAQAKFGGTTKEEMLTISDPRVIYCMWLAMLHDRGARH